MVGKNKKKKTHHTVKKTGFSTVELLVSISIMAIIFTIAIPRYLSIENRYEFNAVALDTLLEIRETQVFSISAHETSGNADDPYGIHFELVTPGSFVVFRDLDDDGSYDAGELIKSVNFKSGYEIGDICLDNGGGYACTKPEVAVSFERPIPHTIFDPVDTKGAKIIIENDGGTDTRTIEVLISGLIQLI